MGMSGGGSSPQNDGITITLNSSNKTQIADNVVETLGDAMVGVVFGEAAAGVVFSNGKADYTSQAAGKESTIDTGGGTTATFSTNKYTCTFPWEAVVDAHGVTLATTGTRSGLCGFKISTNKACTLTKITKVATCTSTKAYILDSSKAQIATADFSGNDATFNQALANGTTYYVCTDSATANYTYAYKGSESYPKADTNINWTGGLSDGADNTTEMWNIASVTTQTDTSATIEYNVLTNALSTLDGTWSYLRVHAYGTSIGTGNTITFDFAADGSTYSVADAALDTWISVGALSGAKLRLNLNKGSGTAGTTTSVRGYAILVV